MTKIIMNCANRETRVAVMEEERLVELFIERPVEKRVVGNVYKGRVSNVVPGMQAAFVDIGVEKNAFLYVDDCLTPDHDGTENKPRINEILKEGQEIIVQVVKEPFGSKGARVTTHITLPGRYTVYVPNNEDVGVSRRVHNEKEKERLRDLANTFRQEGEGIIMRTAAEGIQDEELLADLQFLRSSWKQAIMRSKALPIPSMIYSDLELAPRIVRDLFSPDVDEIIIDSRIQYNLVLQKLGSSIPELSQKMKLYQDSKGIFEVYHIEHEIDKALKPKVWLKNGSYIVINQTEALTSIDVNTGKFTGGYDLEETVHKTNLEATREIARQLRLRDIGGIIIIDFIDMEKESNKENVLEQLELELNKDRTKSHILGLTRLGLVEMTRKKVRQNLRAVLTSPCPCCEGQGKIKSENYVAGKVERELREYKGSGIEAILVEVHPRTGSVLIGNNGEELRRLEQETGISVYVKGNENLNFDQYNIPYAGSETEVRRRALPVEKGEIVSLKVEEKHAYHPQDGIARMDGYIIQIADAGIHTGKRVLIQINQVFQTNAIASLIQYPNEL